MIKPKKKQKRKPLYTKQKCFFMNITLQLFKEKLEIFHLYRY